jgi:hypothetical protein
MKGHTMIATVIVDDHRIHTGTVYHVRANGWPCIQTTAGVIASGPMPVGHRPVAS